jgi:hypothetical protein
MVAPETKLGATQLHPRQIGQVGSLVWGETAVLGEILHCRSPSADFEIDNWQSTIGNVKKLIAATDSVRRAREASWPLRRAIPIHNSRAARVSSKIRDLLCGSLKTTGQTEVLLSLCSRFE